MGFTRPTDVDQTELDALSASTSASLALKADLAPAANTRVLDYTLVLSDAGKVVEMNLGTATVLTVPPNASVAFPVGTVIDVARIGAGSVTITPGAAVTIPNVVEAAGTTSRTITTQFGAARLRQRAVNQWVLTGGIS
jgi:hypothetical protein